MSRDNFTLSAYGQILQSALNAGYGFESFSEIGYEALPQTCLLRHDIDSELLGCGPMLDVERELGVRATYFVMTRSIAYNLFCIESRAMVERILADGHRLGMHFMGELCENDTPSVLAEKIMREQDWLQKEFGTAIDAVSFHQPSQAILDGNIAVPGLVNTYNKSQTGAYFYVSDTNMTWRRDHPLDIFSRKLHNRLQLLIHPIWWTSQAMTTEEKWVAVLRMNQAVLLEHWKARERTLLGKDLMKNLNNCGIRERH